MRIGSAIILVSLVAWTNSQHLLLAGGGLDKNSDFFWNRLVQLAGGKESVRIGVITAGRENPEEAATSLTEILSSYSAVVTPIGVHGGKESANDPAVANLVAKQSAIFIDDGDVHDLINFLRNSDGSDSLVLAAMREKFRRGIISGSGAGAAVLSGKAIPISGHSYETLIHGTKPIEAGGRRHRKFPGCVYIPDGGLGFLNSWLIEPFFNNESLQGRTIRLLLDTRSHQRAPALAIGIDKEMALAVYRVGSDNEFAEVMGNKGGITLINATDAKYHTNPLKISGVTVTFLSEDDKLILATDEILPASWKSDLSGEEWHVLSSTSHDIFSAHRDAPDHHVDNFNRMAKRLFNSALSKKATHYSHQTSPQVVVEMDRRLAYAFHNDSPSTSEQCISYAGLRISMHQNEE